ncbi:hypothetical protein [Methylosinus sporium]|nr:hypothetical protein [Methylosinus sporium]
MKIIVFQKGATSWGFAIGPFWLYWPFVRFWRCGVRPTCGIERDE